MRFRAMIAAAAAALAVAPAAAGQVIASVPDPAGDTTLTGTAPDILSTVVEFVDGDPTTAADDALRVTTTIAAPFVASDRLFWRIDADQNPGTGEPGFGDEVTARFDLFFAPTGPTLRFFYYGPVAPAEQVTAPPLSATVYQWQKPLSALRLTRGQTVRMRFYSERPGESFDYSPGADDVPPGVAVTIPNPPLVCPPPVVTTARATGIGRAEATATGVVAVPASPARCATTYRFEYGRPGTPLLATPAVPIDPGSPSTPVAALLTGLRPNTPYDYRLIAQNPDATVAGATLRFRSRAPAGLESSLSPTTRRGQGSRLLTRLVLRLQTRGDGPTIAQLARSRPRPRVLVRCLRGCTLRRAFPLRPGRVGVPPMRPAEAARAGFFFGPRARRAPLTFRGRAVLAGDLAQLFRDSAGRRYVFPFGSAVEVRVTRPGHLGAVSTIRLGTAVARKSCPLTAAGRPGGPCRPA